MDLNSLAVLTENNISVLILLIFGYGGEIIDVLCAFSRLEPCAFNGYRSVLRDGDVSAVKICVSVIVGGLDILVLVILAGYIAVLILGVCGSNLSPSEVFEFNFLGLIGNSGVNLCKSCVDVVAEFC